MGLVVAIVLAFFVFHLYTRVRKLEKRLDGTSENATPLPQAHEMTTPQPVEMTGPGGSAADGVAATPQASQEAIDRMKVEIGHTVHEENRFIAWIKEDFLVKLGALLLLIAFGWFVSLAFTNNWIGPMGRIALGLIAGAGIMIAGELRIRTHLHQGGIFIALGSTIVIMTVWAAREIYDFFTPLAALVIMFLAAAFVAFASVQFKSRNLAFAGLILACIAPLFTNSPAPDIAGLFSYLLVIVLGSLWIVYLRGWNELVFAALVIVFLYGLPFLSFGFGFGGSEQDIALLFSFIFTAVFFVANVLGILHQKEDSASHAHIVTAFGTGLYLIVWILAAASEEWQSLLFVAWMLVFIFGAFAIYRGTSRRAPFYIYSGLSIVLLAAATAVELEGTALTFAYTIEAAFLVILAAYLVPDSKISQRLSFLFLGPILLSAESVVSSEWRDGFLHNDFFVLLVLSLSLLTTAAILLERNTNQSEEGVHAAKVLLSGGLVYIALLVWLVPHSIFAQDVATFISLTIYTIVGLISYVASKQNENTMFRYVGILLLAFVIIRLLFVDVWQMELAGRIITFFVIGTLLISTAFIRRSRTSEREHLVEQGANTNQYE